MRQLQEYSKRHSKSRVDSLSGGVVSGLRQLRMKGGLKKSISMIPEFCSGVEVENEEEEGTPRVPEGLSVVLKARNEL